MIRSQPLSELPLAYDIVSLAVATLAAAFACRATWLERAFPPFQEWHVHLCCLSLPRRLLQRMVVQIPNLSLNLQDMRSQLTLLGNVDRQLHLGDRWECIQMYWGTVEDSRQHVWDNLQ
jgi:hypothetical protein